MLAGSAGRGHTRPPSDFHHNDDYSTVRPLSRDRLQRLFGTEKPTPAQFETLTTDRQHPDYDAFWFEERVRWTGHYVLLYADGEDTPAEIGFWGDQATKPTGSGTARKVPSSQGTPGAHEHRRRREMTRSAEM